MTILNCLTNTFGGNTCLFLSNTCIMKANQTRKKYVMKTMRRRKVPYVIRKTRGKNCFQVKNKKTQKIFSRCTTRENAVKQDKLLRALLYNPQFRTQRS